MIIRGHSANGRSTVLSFTRSGGWLGGLQRAGRCVRRRECARNSCNNYRPDNSEPARGGLIPVHFLTGHCSKPSNRNSFGRLRFRRIVCLPTSAQCGLSIFIFVLSFRLPQFQANHRGSTAALKQA